MEHSQVLSFEGLGKGMYSSSVSVAVIKYSDQERLWEERIYLAYTSGSLSILEGNWGRGSGGAGAGGCFITDVGSVIFLVQPRSTCLGMVLHTVGWAFLYQLSTRAALRHAHLN